MFSLHHPDVHDEPQAELHNAAKIIGMAELIGSYGGQNGSAPDVQFIFALM